MSKVLFLSIPSHGHMNPTLGLADALIRHGEQVTFFSSNEFKKSVEEIGADFIAYKGDLNIFQKKQDEASPGDKKMKPGFLSALFEPEKFIDDVLAEIKDLKFDYIVFSAAYPYAQVIAQILNIPAISSYAVFATLKDLFGKKPGAKTGINFSFLLKWMLPVLNLAVYRKYKKVRRRIAEKHGVKISRDVLSQFLFKGELNIAYTSKYFIPNLNHYDDSFIFIGPPIYNKKYNVDFPFEKLVGKKVIYISLGSVFSNHSTELYQAFFKGLGNMDAIVVMAAYQVDLAAYDIPENFIIRDYVPQLEVLKYTSVAITHAGMNSIGDLLYNNVPFVSIPLGADQFFLANRAAELGATIVLDLKSLNAEIVRESVEKVITDPGYLEHIRKISNSFRAAGGYEKAVEEIYKLKKRKGFAVQVPALA